MPHFPRNWTPFGNDKFKFLVIARGQQRPFNKGRFMMRSLLGIGALVGVTWCSHKACQPRRKEWKDKKKVVVIGSGWSGLSFASQVDLGRYDVKLLSERNYFLFTPLVNSVLFGSMDSRSIAEPVRKFFDRLGQSRVEFREASCKEIDVEKQLVKCVSKSSCSHDSVDHSTSKSKKSPKSSPSSSDELEFEIPYDKLVIAVGSRNNDLGIVGVSEHCHFLRNLDDARVIRNRIMDALERASVKELHQEASDDNATASDSLRFVIVGGGPLSIQFATQFSDLMNTQLKKLFPEQSKHLRLTFVDIGDEDRNRNTYDTKISNSFLPKLEKYRGGVSDNRVEVVRAKIKDVQKGVIHLEHGVKLRFGTCIWITGMDSVPLVKQLQTSATSGSQTNPSVLITSDSLAVSGIPNVWAIGECGSVSQSHVCHKFCQIFDELDANGDGFISEDEFKHGVNNSLRKFPQLSAVASKAEELFEEGDVNKDGVLSKAEFKDVLSKVRSKVTHYPTTAQTAAQQGAYLAQNFNNALAKKDIIKMFKRLDVDNSGTLDEEEITVGLKEFGLDFSQKLFDEIDVDKSGTIDEDEFVKFILESQHSSSTGDWKHLAYNKIPPFRYKHLGGFEYVAYDSEITERGSQSQSVHDGFGAWWFWHSVYSNRLFSWRHRFFVCGHWLASKVFGKEVTRL